MELRPISWKSNPAKLKDDIDHNFQSISTAFNALLQMKLDGITLDKVTANEIFLGPSPLSSIFLSKGDKHDVVRVQCGDNIMTGGTQNRPVVSVSGSPIFDSVTASNAIFGSIQLGGRPLHDIFYSRLEASGITHPKLGDNLSLRDNTIHLSSSPTFDSIRSNSLTASTASFSSITYRGTPIDRFFGSHTYVRPGKNTTTGGTANNPVVSVVDDPDFNSIRARVATMGQTSMNGLTADTISSIGVTSNELRAHDVLSVGGAFHVTSGRINVGCEPEQEVSSFLRTAVRIVAPENSPIHHALVVQNRNHMVRRTLNDQSVDFVIRGDGKVGIGAFDGLRSRLTIKTSEGHDQIQLSTPFTPDGSNDKRGTSGNVTWDDQYVYVKTNAGWKRSQLSSF